MAPSTDRQTDEGKVPSRRALLGALGGAVGLPLGAGASVYAGDRRFTDEDSDGIPDEIGRASCRERVSLNV